MIIIWTGRAAAVAVMIAGASAATASTQVAQWNMDESSGTTMNDSSGSGNNGTLVNVVTSGAGYVFDGSTSLVDVPNAASLNPGTSNFSFSVQVQTDHIPPSGTDYDVMRKGLASSTGGDFKIEVVNSNGVGKAVCEVKDNAGHSAEVTAGPNVADGALHSIKCSKTAGHITLTVDGVAHKKYRTLGAVSNSADLIVGARTTTDTGVGNDWYSGTLRSAGMTVG